MKYFSLLVEQETEIELSLRAILGDRIFRYTIHWVWVTTLHSMDCHKHGQPFTYFKPTVTIHM